MPDWLALREPADAVARAQGLIARLDPLLPPADTLDVVDLGAGTGANLRWLAPRLMAPQRWLLVDVDEELLARAAIATPDACRVAMLRLDLANALDGLTLPRRALVTASALLDLVSQAWLRSLAARCAEAEAAVLFALTYDGRIDATPPEPDDDRVRTLVNRHQRRDKGFGPALGPTAPAATVEAFEARGYRLWCARSDWRLGPADADLQRALIDGWASAAADGEGPRRGAVEEWRARRLEHVAAGRSEIRVGHVDVAGLPPARGRG